MIVDLYARLSDDKGGKSHSVENQIRACKNFAETKEWAVGDIYRDDSMSATKRVERPAFKALLERPDKRPVLVFEWERLVRVLRDLVLVLDQNLEVNFVEAAPFDLSTEDGRFMATVYTGMATKEISTRTKRQKLAADAAAAEGKPYWRFPPFGHNLDGSINGPEADRVRVAVTDLLAGKTTLYGIAEEWNSEGVRTSKRKDGIWRSSAVREMLTNPRMAGVLFYKGERMPRSQIKPILDLDTYDALRGLLLAPARRAGRKSGGPTANLLTGLARCGICNDGTTVHATSGQDKNRKFEVYRCSRRSHCRHYRSETDAMVIGAVFGLMESEPELLLTDRVDEKSAASAARLRDQLSEWEEVSNELGPAEYLRITKPLRIQLEAAERAMQKVSTVDLFRGLYSAELQDIGDDMAVLLHHVAPWWDGLTLERQRTIVDQLFEITLLPRTNQTPKDSDEHVQIVRRAV